MLHIIHHSPSQSQGLKNCLAIFSSEDILLFIENGIFCVLQNTEFEHQLATLGEQGKIFVLAQHAAEYGMLQHLINNMQLIDFDEFVELTVAHTPVLHW